MITKLDQIVRAVQGRGRKKLAVAYAQDSHTLEAVNAATDMGIVEAILIGDREQIVKVCMADGIDPEKFSIVDEKNDAVCVETAVRMIRDSMADVLMKGLVSTDKYMRGILNKDFGLLPPKGVLSHVAVLELPMYHKLLLVSDVAVIPYPDMNQKIRIAKYLIGTSRTLGIRAPKLGRHRTERADVARHTVVGRCGDTRQNGRPGTAGRCVGRRSAGGRRRARSRSGRDQKADEFRRGRCRLPAVSESGCGQCLLQGGDQAVRCPVGRYGRRNAVPVRIDLARRLAESKLYSIALAALSAD